MLHTKARMCPVRELFSRARKGVFMFVRQGCTHDEPVGLIALGGDRVERLAERGEQILGGLRESHAQRRGGVKPSALSPDSDRHFN